MGFQYPPNHRYKYETELLKIKQRDFYTFDDYIVKIKTILRKYSLCANLKPELQTLKEEETFLRGLHRDVFVEMSKLGHNTIEGIAKCIRAVEGTLFQVNPYTNSERFKHQNNFTIKSKIQVDKFCKRHGTCKRSTEECHSFRKDF